MKTISVFILFFSFPVFSNTLSDLKIDCKSECRFHYQMNCPEKTKKISLSTDKKKPSTLYTDMNITCSVSGTSNIDGKIKYTLAITGKDEPLGSVHSKEISISKNTPFNYSYFTFSNPYKKQSVQVTLGKEKKTYYFNGHPVH